MKFKVFLVILIIGSLSGSILRAMEKVEPIVEGGDIFTFDCFG